MLEVSVAKPYRVAFADLVGVSTALSEVDAVITDKNVYRLWGHLAASATPVLQVEPGEASKSVQTYDDCLQFLAASGLQRSGVIAAFGGGVVGDLVGFVAATYMRGIRYVQVPTTLLSMVDSSVGGKVAIDLPQGKNLAGAFHNPEAVCVCSKILETLNHRHMANGHAEVVKMGYAVDSGILELLHGEMEAKILACVRAKAQIVEQDEFDRTGLRATLNFGHTVGHAIESLSGYDLLHGEAIAIGMVVETRLGERLGMTPRGVAESIVRDLELLGLPTRMPPGIEPKTILESISIDKKATRRGLGFSLLSGVGQCKLVTDVVPSEVLTVLDEDN